MTPLFALLAALGAATAAGMATPSGSGHRLRSLTRFPAARQARRRPPALRPVPGALVLDLVAAVLDGGASPATAARRVADALTAAGDPAGTELARCAEAVTALVQSNGDAGPPGTDRLAAALAQALLLAAGTGLAPAPLVRRAAAAHRRHTALAATAAARRLAVLLMLPTGLCLLPAFVFLGLVPVAIDLFSGLAPAFG